MKTLFTFADLSSKSTAAKQVARYLRARRRQRRAAGHPHGHQAPRPGVTYREMVLTFADSQQVVLRIKQTGDIFQVALNGRVS